MKKLLVAVSAVTAFVLASSTAQAAGPYNAIPEENPAWQDSGRGSIENVHNPALRFGSGGRIAISGEGGEHANENSAVEEYTVGGSQSIVDPQGF